MSLDLMPGIYHGALVEVVEAEGTGLVGDHALGATVLTVAAGGFRTAGSCRVNGTIYAYVREGLSLSITPALVADADNGTPVESLTPAGEPETRKVAVIDLDMLGEEDETGDEDANLPRAEIPGEWSGFYPLGTEAAGAIVEVEATTYGYRVKGRPTDAPLLSGTAIDPATPIPGGQTFSLNAAPTDATGYPEDFGWWQVDADDKVLGFWRNIGGIFTPQEFDVGGALFATNAFIEYLNGKVITGATMQTRAATDRGIKLGEVSGATNYDEAFIVFNESGVPFLKAVPAEELAVIAGEVKMSTGTVSDGASLGGVTEITRATDGTAGAVRLTGYTTAPKSAPTVTTGYDTVQFNPDGKWGDRSGWTTDGTYWYTVWANEIWSYRVERWNASGVRDAQSDPIEGAFGVGCVYLSGSIYVLEDWSGFYQVSRINAGTLNFTSTAEWTQNDGTRTPAIGADAATGELLIAQSRPSDATIPNRVRIRRYSYSAGSLTAGTSVDTDFAYSNGLAGVTYGTHDLGANRYIFSTPGNNIYRVVDTTGAAVSAEEWQSGMGGKVGFAYTGGAFVSMDTTGLMRTYTGQDKATAIGDANLTKWVANTLANVTYETDRSPRAKITIPKRTKLNVTTSAINTGGANSPDRVKIYVGQGATNPARTAMWKQAGLLSGAVLPNLATNPSFESGATGWAAVSGSTAPAASTDQSWVGAQSLKTQRGAGTAIQIASRTITTLLTSGAGQYSYAIRVWIPGSVPTTGNTGVRIAGAGTTTQDKDTDLRDQWVTLSGTFTWDGSGAVILYSLDSAIQAGTVIYLDGFHLVAGSTVPTTYVEGSGAPTDTPIGITSGALSSIATSGTNPPSANGFQAVVGTIQRLELADGTAFIDGVGAGSAWTTYTPTFTAATTNPTLASFTRAGRYARIGRNTITFSIVITATAASGFGSGTYEFGLPVAARNADEVIVTGSQTGPTHTYIGRGETTTTFRLSLTSTEVNMNSSNSAMASGTVVRISGTYEAA